MTDLCHDSMPLAVAYCCLRAAARLALLLAPLRLLTKTRSTLQTLSPAHQDSAAPQAHLENHFPLPGLHCPLLPEFPWRPSVHQATPGTGPHHCATPGGAIPKEYHVMGAPKVAKHRGSTAESRPPTLVFKIPQKGETINTYV